MKTIKAHLIAGARPNFIKIAPLFHQLRNEAWAELSIVHTGQHYDFNMAGSFFSDLGLPNPHYSLGVGSASHGEQTGRIMICYEKICEQQRPDLVVVVGDVNSTLACSLVAAKACLPLAHIEAGLRSFDRTMPEEVNRIVCDAVSDILWTHCAEADQNLLNEGVAPVKIERVGNIMIDSLMTLRQKIEEQEAHQEFGLNRGGFGLVTLHRPSNVDDPERLAQLGKALSELSDDVPIVFPVHPRTARQLSNLGLPIRGRVTLCEPLPYTRFMSLVSAAQFLVTDSGGIQEETTYLGIPCLTLRPNTERSCTISLGTNMLTTIEQLREHVRCVLAGNGKRGTVPELWDGKTSQRIAASIKHRFGF